MSTMEQPQGTPTPEQPIIKEKDENVLADEIKRLNASIAQKTKDLAIVGRESDLGKEIIGQLNAARS